MIGAGIVALLAYVFLLFFQRPAWFPPSITAFGTQFDGQFHLTLVVCAAGFVLVHLGLAMAIHGRTGGKRGAGRRFDQVAALVAALVFLGLALQGTRIWAGAHPSIANDTESERIEVYAHQFAWSFRYPGSDGKFGRTAPQFINDVIENPFGIDPSDGAGKDDVYSATLRVPRHREVVLVLHSRDVIHDFFVRELRFKQDVVPGMEIPIRFRADEAGTYEIACSELCGIGHSQMRATMVVMPEEAFDRWKREKYSAATTR